VVIRYEFRFAKESRLVYRGEQSAIFLKQPDLSAGAGDLGEEGGDG
jgi:hypothetical protein